MLRLWAILTTFDTEPVELGLSLLLLVWAGWLARPDIDTFGSSSSFRIMAELGGQNALGARVGAEDAWAIVMLAVALVKLCGLLRPNLTLRRVGAVLGTFVWVAIAVCVGAANPIGTGIVVYPTFALASMWTLFRLLASPRGIAH